MSFTPSILNNIMTWRQTLTTRLKLKGMLLFHSLNTFLSQLDGVVNNFFIITTWVRFHNLFKFKISSPSFFIYFSLSLITTFQCKYTIIHNNLCWVFQRQYKSTWEAKKKSRQSFRRLLDVFCTFTHVLFKYCLFFCLQHTYLHYILIINHILWYHSHKL